MYNANEFYRTFPGGYLKAKDYDYYLVGDIFMSQQIVIPMSIYQQIEEVSLELGRFSALIEKIPNPHGYIMAFTKKEATLSSRIEGTQTKLEEAFMDEQDIVPEKRNDWQEVVSYIRALNHSVEQLEKLPLCNRVIKSTHKILLSQARGQDKLPGEFRRSQNWIGGSRPDNAHFVPPAMVHLDLAMSNLEKFIQDTTIKMPVLIKAALIHYQFETIHPFLDGNGRIGRMLISLFLLEKKIIKYPILYISNFFESNRNNYYNALEQARKNQDGVIRWISFFLDGVLQTATQGIRSTQNILDLKEELVTRQLSTIGRMAKNGQRLLDLLFERPVITSKEIAATLNLSMQATQNLVNKFVLIRILDEITGFKRNRIFMFTRYLSILNND